MNRGEPHHTAGVGDSSKAGNEKQVSPTASLSSINMLISPGWILTEMANAAFDVADNPSNARKDALQRHPAGRMGQPTDIASMAVWLASNESRFVTGQCYVVDGGLTAASPLNPSLF